MTTPLIGYAHLPIASDLLPIRPPKIKKKIDTKASKGRKLRFTVHEKIQNFMVPIPRASWQQDQTDDLFASLFGKGAPIPAPAAPVLTDGFKLFG